MEHISKEEFFRVLNVHNMKPRNRKMYNRIYNRVLKEWETPETWFSSDNKRIYIETRVTDCYWVVWSMLNSHKLPFEFVKILKLHNSQTILENTLIDYERVSDAVETMKTIFSESYLKIIYAYVLRICILKGVNEFKKITLKDISIAFESGVIKHDGARAKISLLLYYAGYTDKLYKDSNLYKSLKNQKLKLADCWSEQMKLFIEQFIQDLYNSKISGYKMEVEKKSALNLFGKWYKKEKGLDSIKDLLDLDRSTLLNYISYINKIDDITSKTKRAKLLALKQFVDWSKIKEKKIVKQALIISNNDLKVFNNHKRESTLDRLY